MSSDDNRREFDEQEEDEGEGQGGVVPVWQKPRRRSLRVVIENHPRATGRVEGILMLALAIVVAQTALGYLRPVAPHDQHAAAPTQTEPAPKTPAEPTKADDAPRTEEPRVNRFASVTTEERGFGPPDRRSHSKVSEDPRRPGYRSVAPDGRDLVPPVLTDREVPYLGRRLPDGDRKPSQPESTTTGPQTLMAPKADEPTKAVAQPKLDLKPAVPVFTAKVAGDVTGVVSYLVTGNEKVTAAFDAVITASGCKFEASEKNERVFTRPSGAVGITGVDISAEKVTVTFKAAPSQEQLDRLGESVKKLREALGLANDNNASWTGDGLSRTFGAPAAPK